MINQLYEELFALSPDGILLIDAETQRVVEFNDQASDVSYPPNKPGFMPRIADVAGRTQPSPTIASAHGTKTILLVDDVGGLRLLAKRMLESVGYTVLTAASGEEALRVLGASQTPVHLLVTDVVMPGMNGRTLAERVLATHPGMKVLYMSGYTDDVVVQQGVLNERMPFLAKPFTAVELIRKVREVLDAES